MMKTLRSKIFLFVSLLLILPSLPLSFFVLQLLDQTYQIGVNPRVESALDGALSISADFYQMNKNRLQKHLNAIIQKNNLSNNQIKAGIESELPAAQHVIISLNEWNPGQSLVSAEAVRNFLKTKQASLVWPNPEHSRLYGLALLSNNRLLQIEYPLPESFQKSAGKVQEVNQIFKTLGFARKEIRKSFLYTFLSIYAVGLMISILGFYWISRRITRPVELLTAATTEIGKGNLSYQINLPGRDEFAQLTASFNKMVQELSANQKKIIGLEKMATWQQLARRLAHEIKNPLTPIQLMAQQMRDSYKGDDSNYENALNQCYDIIDEEIESLKRLVREFSDFARLPEFHIEQQNVIPIIQILQKLYEQSNLKVALPAREVRLAIDGEYLKRALINLVDNALAASQPEQPVLIKLEIKNDTVEIVVSDQGEGIAPENLETIFEPYYSSKRSGVGLGLPIVKKIVEEHQGTIRVISEPGEGSRFTIVLPILDA